MIEWGKEVPKDLFVNWSSGGNKDEWATIISNDRGWYHAWEYPHLKGCLKECLKDAGWLLNELLQHVGQYGKKISVTVCQI